MLAISHVVTCIMMQGQPAFDWSQFPTASHLGLCFVRITFVFASITPNSAGMPELFDFQFELMDPEW